MAPNGGECPYCGRVMSKREGAEQGACNECSGGAFDAEPEEYEQPRGAGRA